jgi:hypothetical protein
MSQVRLASPKRLAVAGGVLTLLACVALTAAGYYFDATGGGPSDVLMWSLWGSLLLGVALLVAAAVRAAVDESRPRP